MGELREEGEIMPKNNNNNAAFKMVQNHSLKSLKTLPLT